MNKKIIDNVIATPKKLIVVALPIACITMFFLAYLLFKIAIEDVYISLSNLLLAIVFSGTAIYALYHWATAKTYEIEGPYLLIKNIRGNLLKKVPFTAITGYTLQNKSNSRYNYSYQELTLLTHTGNYKLTSFVYNNFLPFLKTVTYHHKRNNQLEKLKSYKAQLSLFIALIILGIATLLLTTYLATKKHEKLTAKDITAINITLANNPKFKYNKEGDAIALQLTSSQYPKFTFEITENYISDDFANSTTVNDSVTLQLLATDYAKKLIKTQPLTFWDKTVNYRKIKVYGLKYNQHTYYTFADEPTTKNTTFIWLLAAIGSVLTVVSVYFIITIKKPVNAVT